MFDRENWRRSIEILFRANDNIERQNLQESPLKKYNRRRNEWVLPKKKYGFENKTKKKDLDEALRDF